MSKQKLQYEMSPPANSDLKNNDFIYTHLASCGGCYWHVKLIPNFSHHILLILWDNRLQWVKRDGISIQLGDMAERCNKPVLKLTLPAQYRPFMELGLPIVPIRPSTPHHSLYLSDSASAFRCIFNLLPVTQLLSHYEPIKAERLAFVSSLAG